MSSDQTKNQRATTSERRVYERPRVVETATFEHLVLSCGRQTPATASCNPRAGGSVRS